MTNKQIAEIFDELATIMELHEENTFKIRSYQNAYLTLRKLGTPITAMSLDELTAIKGVGKAISEKIVEIIRTGDLTLLKKFREQTPVGVQEMLKISGFGAKKIRTVWKELEIESIGELEYACHENRLMELKGFGEKTQKDLLNKLEFFKKSELQFHFSEIENAASILINQLKISFSPEKIDFYGALRRKCEILSNIEILISTPSHLIKTSKIPNFEYFSTNENTITGKYLEKYPVTIFCSLVENFGTELFRLTGSAEFLEDFYAEKSKIDLSNCSEESQVFNKAALKFVPPELREKGYDFKKNLVPTLIEVTDIKGVIHSHSTWSDGIHTLREMALHAKNQGFEYLGITDHSKAAFYANGLKDEQLLSQINEINKLNQELAPFKIFKGIESDILNDGSLDYENEILSQLDFVIASVHSNLKMNIEKATSRILKAIENPHTTILGHPTGRLLLSRAGYPIDYQRVIDACAANKVAIEINAHPYRLDLDWRWISYAIEKKVLLSINPDAHSKEGIELIKYGVNVARKGGLEAKNCLSAFSRVELEEYFLKNKK